MTIRAMPPRTFIRPGLQSALILSFLLAACGTGGVTTSTPVEAAGQQVGVAVTPTETSVGPAGQVVFAAAVTGTADTAVTWTIREGTGSVSAAGLFTAPATLGTYHVVATSVADPTKSAAATVTVTAAPSTVAVAVSPATASVSGCQTATFAATVTGATNTAVTWSVLEGASGGTVSAGGVYTAPRAAGTYHVVATSAADGSRTASAAVAVATKVLSVALTPASASLTAGATRQLSATVTTTCGAFPAGS